MSEIAYINLTFTVCNCYWSRDDRWSVLWAGLTFLLSFLVLIESRITRYTLLGDVVAVASWITIYCGQNRTKKRFVRESMAYRTWEYLPATGNSVTVSSCTILSSLWPRPGSVYWIKCLFRNITAQRNDTQTNFGTKEVLIVLDIFKCNRRCHRSPDVSHDHFLEKITYLSLVSIWSQTIADDRGLQIADRRRSQKELFPYNRGRSQTIAERTVAIHFGQRKCEMYTRVVGITNIMG